MRLRFMEREPGSEEDFVFNPYTVIKYIKQTVKGVSGQQGIGSSSETIQFDEFEAFLKESSISFHKQCLWSFFGFFKNEDGIYSEK